MKEIKFRAWDGKSMKFLDRCDFEISGSVPMVQTVDSWGNRSAQNWPLMIYTGLKDKRGRDIYEGDILSYTEHWIGDFNYSSGKGVVAYDNGSFCIEDELLTPGLCKEEIQNCNIKVIGNIHENPDLLQNKAAG